MAADIRVGFGATRFCVEVNRDLQASSRPASERSHLTQATDYARTSATLAMLLLDLTPIRPASAT